MLCAATAAEPTLDLLPQRRGARLGLRRAGNAGQSVEFFRIE